jgi:hypothetical protein
MALRAAAVALGCVVLAYAYVVQPPGCTQTSHFALVKALARGDASIDPDHWETCDKAWFRGHFYSDKAPGLAFVTLPAYEVADAVGAMRGNTLRRDGWPLAMLGVPSFDLWILGLLGVVAPAAILLVLVRRAGERLEPGFGLAAALAFGLATLVLPFSTLLFSHLLSATLAFAGFTVLWTEREGAQRLGLVALGGLLAGAAIVTEYPLGLTAIALGGYALARASPLRRAGAYAAGAVVGVIPLAAYNLWAFGSVTHMSYADGVLVQGESGHAQLGLNDRGLFGIGYPSPHVLLQLLFSSRGLVVLTPITAAAVVGTILLYRRGLRAEALVVWCVCLGTLVYESGFVNPYGGYSPGPRYFIPALPFLCFPLALAFRRFGLATTAVAAVSALAMVAATTTDPLLSDNRTSRWADAVIDGHFTRTLGTSASLGRGWLSIAPFLVAILAATVLAARTTPLRNVTGAGLRVAGAAALGWAILALVCPPLTEARRHAVADVTLVVIAAMVLGGVYGVWLLATVGGARPPAD